MNHERAPRQAATADLDQAADIVAKMSLADKVAGTFTAVVDTLTDAERLHHKMEPEVSREPE